MHYGAVIAHKACKQAVDTANKPSGETGLWRLTWHNTDSSFTACSLVCRDPAVDEFHMVYVSKVMSPNTVVRALTIRRTSAAKTTITAQALFVSDTWYGECNVM